MLDANKDFFEKTGEPLFSSHMLDLSEEPDEENIELCVKYFKKMVPMKVTTGPTDPDPDANLHR